MTAPRAYGLGSGRNGLPERKNYVYGGTERDQPREAKEAARVEAIRQGKLRQLRRAAMIAAGDCPDCSYPLDSYGHDVACGDAEEARADARHRDELLGGEAERRAATVRRAEAAERTGRTG